MAEIMSSRMNGVPAQNGMPATSFITRVSPVGANSDISLGSTIRIKIPAQMANAYLDCKNSFLSFELKNNSAHNDFYLSPAGVGATIINSITLSQAGSTLSDIREYPVLRNMIYKQEATFTSLIGGASGLEGSYNPLKAAEEGNDGIDDAKVIGLPIERGAAHYFAIPMKYLASIFATELTVPLFSRDSLDLEINLCPVNNRGGMFRQANKIFGAALDNTPVDGDIKLSNVELVMSVTQLAPEVNAELLKSMNGFYTVETKNYSSSTHTLPPKPTSLVYNLGLGYSSVQKLNWVIEAKQNDAGTAWGPFVADTKSDFISQGIREWDFTIDGVAVEAPRGIRADHHSEAIAMQLISLGALSEPEKMPYFISPQFYDAQTKTNVGGQGASYIASLNLCSYKDKEYVCHSGKNTIASSTNLNLHFDGLRGGQQLLHVFSEYRVRCTLDMNGSGLWSIAQ